METCRKVIASSTDKQLTLKKVAAMAGKSSTGGYYLTFDYALRVLRRMRRYHTPVPDNSAGRRMAEIERRTAALQQRRGLTDREALTMVLADGSASSFFICPDTARHIYTQTLKHLRREKSRK